MKPNVKHLSAVLLTCAFAALALSAQEPQHVGRWATVDTPVEARIGAATVALPDGRTLIAGGRDATGTVTASVVTFDPATGLIENRGQLLAPRIGHTATRLADGRVLIIGGSIGSAITSDIEVFDLQSETSTLSGELLQPRTRHSAALLASGQVLIAGGTTTDGIVTASAEMFDPATSTLIPTSGAMAFARRNASATTLIDGRVLIAGGNDGVDDLASAEMFDPTSRLFYALDPASYLSVARSGHTATLLPHNNSVLIAGGTSSGMEVKTSDLFLPAEFPDPYSYGVGRFVPAADMLEPRSRAVAGPFGDDGYSYVMGGGPATTELYRFATIKTDKDDYAPGEKAIITGSGWQPGETVQLVFQEDPAMHEDYRLSVVADASGRIYWDQWAPEWHDLFVRFYLTASDSKSRAQITFTDAMPQSVTLTPASVSVTAGESAQYTTRVIVNGNSNDCTVTLSVPTSLPTGATASFNNNPVTGSVTFSRTLTIATTASGPDRTPNGTYPFTVKVARGANCQGQANGDLTTQGTLVVNGSTAATALSVADAIGTYGSTTQLSATLTSSGSGVVGKTVAFLLNGSPVGTATTSTAGVASLADVSLSGIAAGTYAGAVTAEFTGDSSFDSATAAGKLTIGRADAVIDVDGYSGVYDGDAHGATGTATGVDSEDLSSLLSLGASFTNAPGGTATWTFAGNGNYNADGGSVAITISKADAVIDVDGYSGVYDGDAHGATGTATGVDSEDLSSLLDLGASFTNVPGGTATWTFAGNGNYNADGGSVAITISKADAVIDVDGYSGVYDGDAHGATGTATGVNAEDLSSLLDLGASFTNVPGGTATWTFAGNGNYNADGGSVAITISKADAVIDVDGYTGVYDGEAHGATGTAKGVNDEDLSSLLDLGASFTNVPGGTATWTFAGNGNYNADGGSVAITISKADAIIDVDGYSGVYDGDAHGATGTAKGVNDEDLSSLLDLGALFTNVPGGTATWTFAGNGNYNADGGSVAITISKADAVIDVDGYSGVYDGDAHGATGTAKGVNDEDLSSLLDLGASFTNVPGGTATWTFAGNGNYNADGGSVAITISKADAVIDVDGYTGVYDGDAHGATGTATGVDSEDLSSLLDLGASFTNVPGGTATWTFAGNGNYNADGGNVAITISKADAVIDVDGYSGVYDGDAHGATGTAKGVNDEDLSSLLDLGASFTNVPGGTATWTFAGNGNYNADGGSVAITISKADAVIDVDGYSGVYDGDAHGATGTAKGVDAEDLSSLLDLGASFTNVPGGTATWTFAGNGNYNADGGSVAITISRANATINVSGYHGTYDGQAHGATGSAAGVKGEALTHMLTLGATFVDAPGGTATWTFAASNNYNGATGTVAIVIDKAAQSINWATPAPVVYGTALTSAQLNATVVIGDGVLTYTPAAGAVLPVGAQTLKVQASETTNYLATTATVTLTVNPWHVTGFYNPVTMGGAAVVNSVKGGSTVPLKFNLYTRVGGTELTSLQDVAGFQVFPMSCSAGTYEDPVELTTTGGTSLRYDTTGRQFIQNWQTPKVGGQCYRVTMTARDGSSISAFFKTK